MINFICAILIVPTFICAVGVNLQSDMIDTSADQSLLSQDELVCQFPCWKGLTPGHSTVDDLIILTERDNFFEVDQDQIYQHFDEDGTMTSLQWRVSEKTLYNRIIFDNGIVEQIWVYPNIQFTLSDIIGLYGIPSGYYLDPYPLPESGTLTIYYNAIGLSVGFYLEYIGEGLYVINRTLKAFAFGLSVPQASLRELIGDRLNIQGQHLDIHFTISVGSGWMDYGTIAEFVGSTGRVSPRFILR